MKSIIRPAKIEDAKCLGPFLVRAWQQGFAGIVPEASLAMEDADKTAEVCAKHIADPARIVFIATQDDLIAGSVFAVRPQHRGTEGEIKSLFVGQEFQRQGLGKSLMAHVARQFLDLGLTSLTLGVFRDNLRARSFYEARGGELFDERLMEWHGNHLPECHYRFSDLQHLAIGT